MRSNQPFILRSVTFVIKILRQLLRIEAFNHVDEKQRTTVNTIQRMGIRDSGQVGSLALTNYFNKFSEDTKEQ